MIEARDKEERIRVRRLVEAAPLDIANHEQTTQNDSPVKQEEPATSLPDVDSSTVTQNPVRGQKAKHIDSDLPRMASDVLYEPESWSPKARIRGR
jgi:hypothetical protein